MKYWWKILAVALIIYSFVAGLLVPLKTGIIQVEPSRAKAGQTISLAVEGYNSHYSQEQQQLRAWLKLDKKNALAAQNIAIEGDNRLRLTFQLPPVLPVDTKVKDFSLIIDHPIDGASVLPSALFVTQDSIHPELGQQLWVNADINELHEKESITFPFRNILSETIRNTYYHVPLWFAMMFIFIAAMVYSVRYLRSYSAEEDRMALALTQVGILYGILGLLTGAIWAKHTWGAYWSFDPKQNMAAIAMLIYLAYLVLRASFEDEEKTARISAVYNIFAFATLIPLLYVIPRMVDSLHPGAGGNPAMGGEDLDNTMRLVFYPAIIGWTLFGIWMANVLFRLERLRDRWLNRTYEIS